MSKTRRRFRKEFKIKLGMEALKEFVTSEHLRKKFELPLQSREIPERTMVVKTHLFNTNLSFMLCSKNFIKKNANLEPLDSGQIGLGKYLHAGFLTNVRDAIFTIHLQHKF